MECKDCKYWKRAAEHVKVWEGYGWCQRQAPYVVVGQIHNMSHEKTLDTTIPSLVQGIWPLVRANEWCGEFKKKTS